MVVRLKAKVIPDLERVIELDLVRATEAAALHASQWMGKGDKNAADQAACDAIRGMFDLIPCCGEVVIGEGQKDEAPGIFLGEQLGSWEPVSVPLDIAVDPVDGTTNISKGLPNVISVLAVGHTPEGHGRVLKNLPSFYSEKLAYGPRVRNHIVKTGIEVVKLETPIEENILAVSQVLNVPPHELTVTMLDRPRHEELVKRVRKVGARLRMIGDGDVAGAIAPSLPDSGTDLYAGVGGSPEAVLAAAALRCLGGDLQVKLWPRDDAEKKKLIKAGFEKELNQVYHAEDLASGDGVVFCATGISDSPLLPGVRFVGHTVV
ncbi:MAG TPA: fructose-bisphosphatase class II family protein, partial [Verrucomicrobiae bacterium]|nr:fructose-bisphosphatase class II family protein [Verrucomicrobiae bacterium]